MSDTITFERLIKTNFYRKMLFGWIIPQLLFAVGELGAFVITVIIPPKPITVFLPSTTIPSLGFSDTMTSLFTGIISIDGIILGFSSVCVIYYRRWLDNRIQFYEEKMEKATESGSLEKHSKSEKMLGILHSRSEAFAHVRNHFSRFAKTYIKCSLFAMFFQVLLFASGFFSGFLVAIGLMVNIHAFILILSGLYQIIDSALW